MYWVPSGINLWLASPPSYHLDIDPTAMFAALVAAASALLVAVISAIVAIYQTRRNAKLEKEKSSAQLEVEREKIRFQNQMDIIRVDQEHQRQRKEMSDEAARTAVEQAQTKKERIQAYRNALCADPRIAKLQILDMTHPLDIDRVFVRIRLHREARTSYEIDPELVRAEAQKDPNTLLKANRIHLETRASTALDSEEAIRMYKRCTIVGDPGAGKTTLLKYLAVRAARKQLKGLPDFPIHIELNEFANSHYYDILEFISTRWDDRYGFPKVEARTCIEEHLQAGTALLLLDALDETVIGNSPEEAETSYERTTNAINQLASRYHQSSIVVTARKAGYQQRTRLLGFTELEVLDFRSEDIEQFIDSWFASYHAINAYINANELKNKLARNIRLQTLAANPLILSLIVIVYEDQLDLPDRRAELYKQCVDILLTKWDASRGVKRLREFKPEYKRQLLQEVAYHFHNQRQRYMPERELLDIIAKFLPIVGIESRQNLRVLAEITSENGLLKEQAKHWYGFLHMTMQEYFTSLYIADYTHIDTLLQHIGDPWWEEVYLLYAGNVPDASMLLQKLLGPQNGGLPEDDIFHTQLILAGRCLATRPFLRKVELRKTITHQLLRELQASPYSLVQNRIANTLAEIGGDGINSQLISLLSDPQLDSAVRGCIADALGTLGDSSIIPDLLRLLSDSQRHPAVRGSIADALGALGDSSVIPDLLRLLTIPHLNSNVHERIAVALGTLGDSSVIPDLLRLLTDPHLDPFVRSHFADALSILGDSSVTSDLLRLLTDPHLNYNNVRKHIAIALGTLGDNSVIPDLLGQLSDPQLDSDVRGRIARTLGNLGEHSVVSNLLDRLSDPRLSAFVRGHFADALGILGDSSVIPDLLGLLSNPHLDFEIRGRIASNIGILGGYSVIPNLFGLLSDSRLNSFVRLHITIALGTLGERSVIPRLLGQLSNPQLDSATRQHIAKVLGTLIDDIADVYKLTSLLEASDKDTICSSLWLISQRLKIAIYKLEERNYKIIRIEDQL